MSSESTTAADVPVDQETLPWPYSTARTTGTEYTPLLASILAAGTLDNVSNADDFQAVEDYIRHQQNRFDPEDRAIDFYMFWVYPAGLLGPYHEAEDGTVRQHGLLVTIERGAKVVDMIKAIRENFREEGTAHVHVPPSA